MAKSTIDPEIKKVINESIDKAVKKAAKAIKEANEQVEAEQKNYFKETERLLYSLPALRLKVSQDEEDLKNGCMVQKRKSKDIVAFSTSGGKSSYSPEDDYIDRRIASLQRTKREIQRIERALEIIQEDKYYKIIPLKYWDELSPEDIAERLCCDERTYRRHKNRLINKLKVILFGADAL